MKNLIFLLIIALFYSCTPVDVTDRYELNPKGNIPELVIEGLVTYGTTGHYVKLSKPVSFRSKDSSYVPNATVRISDSKGFSEELIYIGNGVYTTTSLVGKNDGRAYILNVEYNSKSYTATSIMPQALFPIDSLTFTYINEDVPDELIDSNKIYTKLWTKVAVDRKEYYYFKFYKNDSLTNSKNNLYYSDNSLLNGQIPGFPLPGDYKAGDTATFEIFSVPLEAYEFYNTLQNQLQNDGGLFSSPPSNTKGNIQGAIGLFQASYVLRGSLVVTKPVK